jgi:hypothetical protein
MSEQTFTIKVADNNVALAFALALRHSLGGDQAVAIADQIEAQIQPPVPAEPTGDVVVVDRWGNAWLPHHFGWRKEVDDDITDWIELANTEPKVYRREPSPEAVEAQELKSKLLYRLAPEVEALVLEYPDSLRPALREFAAHDCMRSPVNQDAIPVEKVRQVLRSTPPEVYLDPEDALIAYTDLRQRVAALLPEGAQ